MIDIEQREELLRYLRSEGWIYPDEEPQIRPLSGGVSSRTVWVGRENGTAWVLKQSLEKLRVAVDWYSDPQRIHREALGIRWLEKMAPPCTITPLIFEDHQDHILAMQAVPKPHANFKELLLNGQLNLEQIAQFAAILGTIHRESSLRRKDVEPVFADRRFFETLRIEPYYAYTAAQVPESAGFYADLIEDTRKQSLSLVHGDFSPKNILVHSGRLILLDHEVIHFGDPAFDLGFSLTHLLSKAIHVPCQREEFCLSAKYYWQIYRKVLGRTGWETALEPRVVRHTLGCLLARVAGRSPLEYLSPQERGYQKSAALKMMQQSINKVDDLINIFIHDLE